MNLRRTGSMTDGIRPGLGERLSAISDILRREYCRKHQYPWLIAYSGGKDSTLLLQAVWETVATLQPEERRRPITIVGNDTRVESPLVIQHLRDSAARIGKAATEQSMPVQVRITTPAIDQTFWVNVIGRGYIPPTRNFRWCTDRLKIRPTNRLLEEIVGRHRKAVLLIGTRRSESLNRRRTMDRRGVSARKMNPHDTIPGCRMFAPLADLDDNDVWTLLMQRRPPWGGTHRRLIALYRQAGAGECPLVITKEAAPSCGSSSPRFGCWTCTVVAKDRSLRGLIASGRNDTDKLETLSDFREWLVELRENDDHRLPVRRSGATRRRADGTRVLGPFRLPIRKRILQRLRDMESHLGERLIEPAEIDCIKDIWWRDEIADAGRTALLDSARVA